MNCRLVDLDTRTLQPFDILVQGNEFVDLLPTASLFVQTKDRAHYTPLLVGQCLAGAPVRAQSVDQYSPLGPTQGAAGGLQFGAEVGRKADGEALIVSEPFAWS